MNAGGHGSDTAATLVSYRVVDLAVGRPSSTHPAADLASGYRHTVGATPTDVVVGGHPPAGAR